MPKVYIISETGDSIIGLDCEQSISVTRQNEVSRKSVMSGKDISDGYHAGLKTVEVSGIVTYSKGIQQSKNLDPIQFQRAIDSLVDNKQRFTLYSDQQITLLDDIEDCVIGACIVTLDRYSNAIEVSLTIQEVWVSQAAQVGNLYLPPEKSESASLDGSDPKKGKGGKTEVEEKEEERTTMAYSDAALFGFERTQYGQN